MPSTYAASARSRPSASSASASANSDFVSVIGHSLDLRKHHKTADGGPHPPELRISPCRLADRARRYLELSPEGTIEGRTAPIARVFGDDPDGLACGDEV